MIALPIRTSAGQHPDRVAAAVVRQSRRWIGDPSVVVLARSLLSRLAPERPALDGSWVPAALLRLGRGLVHYREPAIHGEIVQSLPVTIAVGGGDCDDLAVVQATIACTLGLGAVVVRRWMTPSSAHVWVAVGDSWSDPSVLLSVDPRQAEAPSVLRVESGDLVLPV